MSAKNKYYTDYALLLSACLFLFSCCSSASHIDSDLASRAAGRWLKRNAKALDRAAEKEIVSVDKGLLDHKIIYYTVNLKPSGFIILSSDDRIEPVIAFSDTGRHNSVKNNPLHDFLINDLTGRLANLQYQIDCSDSVMKWDSYLYSDDLSEMSETDMRVSPLLQSKWGQEDENHLPCYNYYTPPPYEPDGDPNNNIRCGCVATAMAQVMRYHMHPKGSVGMTAHGVKVNGSSRTAYTRGGDGSGGPYQWQNMPLDPNQYTNDVQRRAIGSLCHDAGLTVNMSYSDSGSSAAMRKISNAMSTFFQYSCAVYGVGCYDSAGANQDARILTSMPIADINRMVNPGLDAGFPSILGLDGPNAGHAVVIDGYQYQGGTLYHHLNMGWYGRNNAWYNLPNVTSSPAYSSIDACIYNILPSGSGEIISGRVYSAVGNPVANVVVSAFLNDTLITQCVSDANGIYALVHIPSEHTYVLRAEKEGLRYPELSVYVDKSSNQGEPYNDTTGNVWGADFHHPGALPPLAISPAEPNVVDSNSINIVLHAIDEGLPAPPGRLTYIIEYLPEHGRLYDPNFGLITAVPHALRNDSNSVIYEFCRYYSGIDDFAFKANDGGTPPTGGDSNTAVILLNIKALQIGDTDYFSDYPFHTWKHDSRTQLIYTAQELGSERIIAGMSLNIIQPPPNMLSDFTIRIQHTYASNYDMYRDFTNSGWTVVYHNDELISDAGWKRFNFDTPFQYNGTDNILLDISFNNSSYSISNGIVYGLYAANQDISQSSDSLHGDPLYWTVSMFGGYLSDNFKPSIRVHEYVTEVLKADFDIDCCVSIRDVLAFVNSWLEYAGSENYSDLFDIAQPKDYAIDAQDFAVLASQWLRDVN